MTGPTAGDVVTAAIRDLTRQFDETESSALTGAPDAVHQHRTVVRRLRSVLRTFRDLLDPFAVRQLRGSLREWGSALGVVRDHEVAAQLAEAVIADVAAASSDPRVTDRLVRPERDAAIAAHRRVVEIHRLARLQQMRRLLHDFAGDPPLTAAASAPAERIRRLLLDDADRVLRKARRRSPSLDSRHAVRKRARGLRHAIEGAMTDPPGLFDERMRALASAAHRIQSALGDHRDALFLAARIDRAGVLAGRAGEDGVVYEELAAYARAVADERIRTQRRARKKLAAAIERVAQ